MATTSAAALEALRAQRRAYYQANKERIKARVALRVQQHSEEVSAYQAAYRERNRERLQEQNAAWRAANKERVAASKAEYARTHRPQHAAAYARWLATHPAARRDGHLRYNYGMTIEDYEALLVVQGGCCAICGSAKPGGSGKNFAVDHDHATGEVRGLLCMRCNVRLHALENLGWRAKAESYLTPTG